MLWEPLEEASQEPWVDFDGAWAVSLRCWMGGDMMNLPISIQFPQFHIQIRAARGIPPSSSFSISGSLPWAKWNTSWRRSFRGKAFVEILLSGSSRACWRRSLEARCKREANSAHWLEAASKAIAVSKISCSRSRISEVALGMSQFAGGTDSCPYILCSMHRRWADTWYMYCYVTCVLTLKSGGAALKQHLWRRILNNTKEITWVDCLKVWTQMSHHRPHMQCATHMPPCTPKSKKHSTCNLLAHPGHVGHQKTMEKYELKCGICTSWLGVKMVKSSISLLFVQFIFHPKYPRPSWLSRRSRWPPARQTPTPRFGTRLQALGFGHGGAVGQGLVQMAILSWGSTPPSQDAMRG